MEEAYIGSNGFKGIWMKRKRKVKGHNYNRKITQLELIKGHRKPMPRPTVVMTSKKDKKRKWDWRDEIEDEEDFSLPWEEKENESGNV
jgi:hypothetical protein